MAEVDAGAAEDTEVEDMVVTVAIDMVAEDDMGEVFMVITHMNSPVGTEHLFQKLVYTLHTNGDSSPSNKIIIFQK